MDAILESCAGLDVHQETVVACILTGPLDQNGEYGGLLETCMEYPRELFF
jgi:hypothetical protein